MLRIVPFAALLLILVVGCSQRMVGGPCDYESRLGTAQVVAQDDEPLARFFVVGKGFVNTRVRYSPEMLFPFHGKIDSEREDVPYPARLSVITRGSCTPYRLTLLSNEYFSQGVFLPIHEGKGLQLEETQTFSEIATLYSRLAPVWPKLMLDVCGQTVQQGSSEYNFSLGIRYAQSAVDVLHGMNVPLGQLHAISAGENPCPYSDVFLDETHNGVWVTFLLTGLDSLTDDDLTAAQNGDPVARQKLLNAVNSEESSEPDKKMAAAFVANAAAQGEHDAQLAAGLAYLSANGVPHDRETGVNWINQSARNGYSLAQRELGWMYFYGDIIPQNHALAYAWFLIAAENGDSEAEHEVEEYEKNIDTALEYSRDTLDQGRKSASQLKSEIGGR